MGGRETLWEIGRGEKATRSGGEEQYRLPLLRLTRMDGRSTRCWHDVVTPSILQRRSREPPFGARPSDGSPQRCADRPVEGHKLVPGSPANTVRLPPRKGAKQPRNKLFQGWRNRGAAVDGAANFHLAAVSVPGAPGGDALQPP